MSMALSRISQSAGLKLCSMLISVNWERFVYCRCLRRWQLSLSRPGVIALASVAGATQASYRSTPLWKTFYPVSIELIVTSVLTIANIPQKLDLNTSWLFESFPLTRKKRRINNSRRRYKIGLKFCKIEWNAADKKIIEICTNEHNQFLLFSNFLFSVKQGEACLIYAIFRLFIANFSRCLMFSCNVTSLRNDTHFDYTKIKISLWFPVSEK